MTARGLVYLIGELPLASGLSAWGRAKRQLGEGLSNERPFKAPQSAFGLQDQVLGSPMRSVSIVVSGLGVGSQDK